MILREDLKSPVWGRKVKGLYRLGPIMIPVCAAFVGATAARLEPWGAATTRYSPPTQGRWTRVGRPVRVDNNSKNRYGELSKLSPSSKENFLSKIDKETASAAGGSDCWLWMGAISKAGYGTFKTGRRINAAHRMSLHLVGRPATGSQVVRHTCDVKTCVNPSHLIPGTHAENMADIAARDRHRRGQRRSPHAKIAHEDLMTARRDYQAGVKIADIARRIGSSPSSAYLAVKGITYRYAPMCVATNPANG